MLCDPHVIMFKMYRVLRGVLIYLLLGCSYLPSEPTGSPLQPITLPPSTTQNCSNISQLIQTISQNVNSIIIQQVANNLSCVLNGTPIGWGPLCSASSCKAIVAALPNNPSGYYWILPNSTNTSVQVYCDLTRYLNGSRGWMRVAYLNMSDSTQSCPSNWTNYTAGTYRLCGRPGDNICFGVNFTTYSVPYYKVSGWIYGYQYATCDGFQRYGSCKPCTIDGPYVDGVSITHSQNPRQHLWTYAASQPSGSWCPCYNGYSYIAVPSYVGTNWYCGGQSGGSTSNYYTYPLWQPGTCPGKLSSCCSNSNLPWFYTTLSTNTTDSLEVRLCADEPLSNEDVRLLNLELYVY